MIVFFTRIRLAYSASIRPSDVDSSTVAASCSGSVDSSNGVILRRRRVRRKNFTLLPGGDRRMALHQRRFEPSGGAPEGGDRLATRAGPLSARLVRGDLFELGCIAAGRVVLEIKPHVDQRGRRRGGDNVLPHAED